MKFDLVFVSIDLVHVFVLDLKLNSFVGSEVHMAYRFCVGKATKITILTPYIMVMEWEQTIFEWLLRILSISSF